MDPDVQWYLARDGKQHGPLSSAELKKLVELGHLKPTDLLWRQGFADWRPAPTVFQTELAPQPRAAAPALQPAAAQPRAQAPSGRQETGFGSPQQGYGASTQGYTQPQARYGEADTAEKSPGTGRRVLVAATFMLLLIGAGTWLAYQNRAALMEMAASVTKPSDKKAGETKPAESAKAETKTEAAAPQAEAAAASAGAQPAAAAAPVSAEAQSAIEQKLAASPPWPLLKQEFPEWYGEQAGELAKLSAEGKTDAELTSRMVEQLVALRRKNVDKALAASTQSLKDLAGAFIANLKHLTAEGADVCYGFISKGEASPGVLALMQNPEKSAPVNAQFEAIFKAIIEGKNTPATHAPPVKSDYTVLTGKLNAIGWTQADIQLFANSAELAKAPHERVCKMVHDWFAAHLAIEDAAVQERLLIETLRPVVGS